MSTGRSIGILTILNLISAGLAVVNSVVVAWCFGTSRALEVFFAASTLQALLLSLTQTGQLTEVFLPVYHRVRQERGPEAARAAFAVIVNWMLLGVCMLSGVMALLARPVVDLIVPGFPAADRQAAAETFRLLLPLLPLQVATSLAGTLANAERWFGRPEAAQVALRAVGLLAIALLAAPLGVQAMVVSTWIVTAGQVLVLGWMLARMGYRHRAALHSEGFQARAVFARTAGTFGYVGATQVYAMAFNAALSVLPQGVFAVFKYVQTLYVRTNSVLLRPVSVVFFTHFSEALSRGSGDLRALARAALSKSLTVLAPVVVAAAVAGRHLLGGLWKSSQFGPAELDLAHALLTLLLGLLLASALGQIARKMTMSLGMVSRQYGLAAGAQVASAVLCWVLIGWWGTGGAMAVLVFNEVALAGVSLAVLAVWRPELSVFYPGAAAGRWVLASAAGLAAGWGASALVKLSGWFGAAGTGRGAELAAGAVLAGVAGGVCLLVAGLLGVGEVRKIGRAIHSRLRRRDQGGPVRPPAHGPPAAADEPSSPGALLAQGPDSAGPE